jgi:Tfp pilus assembly protein PilF
MNGHRLFPLLIAALALIAADAGAAYAQAPSSRREHSNRKTLKPPPNHSVRLSALYNALAKAPNAETAKIIETKIEIARLQSGSATADLLMQRARQSLAVKNKRLALELLDSIVSIAPNFIEARVQRATLYYESKNVVRALADLRVIVAKDPKHYQALTGLGIIFEELGEDKLALDAFRRAVAVNPYIEGADEFIRKLSLKVEGREI